MGKTHEALLRAEKELKKHLPQVSSPAQKDIATFSPNRGLMRPTPKWFEELKTKIQTQYADGSMKTIMFTGTCHGEGASATAAGFASCLARDYQFKVLLMDVNMRTPGLHKFFDMDQTYGLLDVFSNVLPFEPNIRDVTQGNLYVITCNGDFSGSVSLFESDRFSEFLKTMRKSFDYLILDAPPVTIFSEAQVISSKVDGVILIIESGKTRRQVALKAKKEIEAAGGNFLGVVLNKRKFYIPKWLYKRL
jgi:capsular exopolysaccharide synthesis family protein